MIPLLAFSLVLADDTPPVAVPVEHVAALGYERTLLVKRMEETQARIDQIDGELARLTASAVTELVAPPAPVSHARFMGVIVDAGPVELIQSVLYNSATQSFQLCQAGETSSVSGKFTLRDGVVVSDIIRDNASGFEPVTVECLHDALTHLVFGTTRGTANVNFIFG